MDEASVCRARHEFEASEPSEMSLKKDERCLVMNSELKQNDGWVLADSLDRPGRHGYVPYEYLEIQEILHQVNLLIREGTEEDTTQLRTSESQAVSPLMELMSVDSQFSPHRDDASTESEALGHGADRFGAAAHAVTAANKLAKEKVAIFVLYHHDGKTDKVCFRARFERLKNGLTNKAKDQIIRRFFQKRPDLQEGPLAHFCAHTESSLISNERIRTQYRKGTILLEVKLKDNIAA